jgi:hypothetical protein
MLRPSRFLLPAFCLCVCTPALGARLPVRIGACVETTIRSVETRLVDGSNNKPIAGSGSAVRFTNGGYQVSYDTVPAIERSRRGDPVRMCLVSIPRDCPKGDTRGREYRTTNLRTGQTWRLPDSEHSCGGA